MTSDVTAPLDGGAEAACITGARRCRDEYPRQFAHLALGVGAGALILLLPPDLPAAILAGALLVGFLVRNALGGVEADASPPASRPPPNATPARTPMETEVPLIDVPPPEDDLLPPAPTTTPL